MGNLTFKYGTMNGGKSAQLLQTAYSYEEIGKTVLVIKPKKDTKDEDYISSRIQGLAKRKVDLLLDSNDSLKDNVLEKFSNCDCILIDESQFLTRKQVDEASVISCALDIPVICFGIRTDFQTKAFEGSLRLWEVADYIEEAKTLCECGAKAIFNARFVDGIFQLDGEQICIDNQKTVKYKSMCPKCYYAIKNKIDR